MASSIAVLWFRRDLRVSDHPALTAALAECEQVVPLFVWDRALVRASGANRLAFLSGCVRELDASLDGRLVIRSGDPQRMVPEVAREVGAEKVYVTGDFGPYGGERDGHVADQLGQAGVSFQVVDSPYAVAPGLLKTGGGTPFQVFTPFSKAWRAHGWSAPGRRPSRLERIDRAGLSNSAEVRIPAVDAELPAPGEDGAHKRLDAFLRSQAGSYRSERDRPDLDSTSRLSPYLRFGCLHPRQILARLEPGGHDRFETELCWREFYADVLFHRPDAARRSYREEFRRFPVDGGRAADRLFEAWAQGRTGYPIVDAGMRQLLAEGWMHNRVRMIVASFLVKDLHIDWGRGARWFMQHLVDGDLASNQLNWQWVAGSGTDAAPYFRIFNPVTQGKKFDPAGDYIRRWVPELAGLSADDGVHEPWQAAGSLFRGDYPQPIVDHAEERDEALARYNRLRS
ncbi:MAG TPA: deoxyribodipyrimidine photo-lyase [Acidimicrobiales bacterium]|nr:deoxyribodipyrimidine photo-lyase [Acidimicrobiales bacterium]